MGLGLLACCMIPYAGLKYKLKKNTNHNQQNNLQDREDFVVHAIVRDGLKLSNKYISAIGCLLNHLDRIDELLKDPRRDQDPIVIGRLLKDIGSEWKLAFALATVRILWLKGFKADEEFLIREYLGKLSDLMLYIDGIGLTEAWRFKPILTVNLSELI